MPKRSLALEFLIAAYGPDKLADPTQAEPVVQRMIQLAPNEPTNYFQLAKIYEDSGEYQLAEETYLKGRDAKPNDPTVYLTVAGYYNRQGDFDKLIENIRKNIELEPQQSRGALPPGDLQLGQGVARFPPVRQGEDGRSSWTAWRR